MIARNYYLWTAILTLLCSAIYFWRWKREYELFYSVFYLLIPFVNVGYLFQATASDLGEGLTATKITYLGGCYLLLMTMLTIFSLCKISFPRWVPAIFISLSTGIYICVLTIGRSDIFYKNESFSINDGMAVIYREYGPMHTVFHVMLILYFVLSIVALVYGFLVQKEASRRNIIILILIEAVSIFAFFFGRAIDKNLEWIPAAYLFDAFMILFIVDRLSLYNVGATVSGSLVEHGVDGFISLDLKRRYLGANDAAKRLLPEVLRLRTDATVEEEKLKGLFDQWISDFLKDDVTRDQIYENGGRIYRIRIAYLYDRKKRRGYQIIVTDDTEHQQYLNTLTDYNKRLRLENEEKTRMLEERAIKNEG